ncbi:hypothetical protein [Ralstonia condita]|uniref:hypothetical protein n=1 Tax=Ralstonia condita TaxID=3058600 RepID=UPI00292EBC50|nr:hypothetical protein [Ralstonia sp. LMG 7141]
MPMNPEARAEMTSAKDKQPFHPHGMVRAPRMQMYVALTPAPSNCHWPSCALGCKHAGLALAPRDLIEFPSRSEPSEAMKHIYLDDLDQTPFSIGVTA